MWPDSAGFVLVGGRSRRMGQDKALLRWGDVTLAGHLAALVAEAAGSSTLVGDTDRYRNLGYKVISDNHPGLGPLAGVEAALTATRADWNLIVACDMPHLTADFLRKLLDQKENVAAESDSAGAVCAVLHRNNLEMVRRAIATETYGWNRFLDTAGVRRLRPEDPKILANLNTPQDLITHE